MTRCSIRCILFLILLCSGAGTLSLAAEQPVQPSLQPGNPDERLNNRKEFDSAAGSRNEMSEPDLLRHPAGSADSDRLYGQETWRMQDNPYGQTATPEPGLRQERESIPTHGQRLSGTPRESEGLTGRDPREKAAPDPQAKKQQKLPGMQKRREASDEKPWASETLTPPSRIENMFAKKPVSLLERRDSVDFKRNLKQFGYDFFSNSAQLLQGIDQLPAGDDYLLGPGDTVRLAVWGSLNAQYELPVDRGGELMIPRAGPVKVWGISLAKARDAVKTALSRYYRNFEIDLGLGRLRTIQVYVVGEVETPGIYPISSMSTIVNALAAAGGPTRNGSLRTIKVTRSSDTVSRIDLYDMLLSGERSKDMRLQNGDMIFVPVIGQVVAVAGEVRRPAIFELNGQTSVAEILTMAGGITASGSLGRIQVERLENNSRHTAIDITPERENPLLQLEKVHLQDHDLVKVFPVPPAIRQVVLLAGNVEQPGEYQFHEGMRLTDLIPSTQSLLSESYLDSVEITRTTPPEYRRERLTVSLRKALAGDSSHNILLQEQDRVKVSSRKEMEDAPRVAINGAVVNPGVYDYFSGMAVRDLVMAAGSLKRSAVLTEAELNRTTVSGDKATPERMQIRLQQALANDTAHNLPLQPDDVLIIRTVTEWSDATDKFVRLKGEVRFPGSYAIARGEKLSSVIARAGGYTDKAYLRGAKFTRRSVQKTQQQRLEETIERAESEVLRKQSGLAAVAASREELDATKATLEGLMKNLQMLKGKRAEGRMVMKLLPLGELEKTTYDLILEGGDELDIPQRPAVVHVLGQVYNPTSFVLDAEADAAEDYLYKAGGATTDAETADIYIVKADGSVYSRQQSSFGFQRSDESSGWGFGGFLATKLQPGDTLVVPQKIEQTAWMRNIKDVTQILANVALTVGTILVGLK